jgi:hypothetical protein
MRFDGMKITIAESDGIDAFGEQADEFVRDILGHESAFVSDESRIGDFIDSTFGNESEYHAAKEEIWRKIEEKYKVDCRGTTLILDILRKINAPKGNA